MTELLVKMALDCIVFARDARHVRDYSDFCKMQLGAGTSYYDRIRVKDQLIDEGFVRIEENRLRLGSAHKRAWLDQALRNGDPEAWEICEIYPKRKLKFDPDNTAARDLGLAGEVFVLEKLKQLLPKALQGRLIHVSLEDDGAGFDISTPSVKNPEDQVLLEVKTSSRSGSKFRLFISRNEVETGLRNPNWRLVLVAAQQGEFDILGVLGMTDFADCLPQDTSSEAMWMSTRIDLSRDGWRPSLP